MRSMEYLYDDICLIRDDMRVVISGGAPLDREGGKPLQSDGLQGYKTIQTVTHISNYL